MKSKIKTDVRNKHKTETKLIPDRNYTVNEQIDLFVAILVNVYIKLEHEKDNNFKQGT